MEIIICFGRQCVGCHLHTSSPSIPSFHAAGSPRMPDTLFFLLKHVYTHPPIPSPPTRHPSPPCFTHTITHTCVHPSLCRAGDQIPRRQAPRRHADRRRGRLHPPSAWDTTIVVSFHFGTIPCVSSFLFDQRLRSPDALRQTMNRPNHTSSSRTRAPVECRVEGRRGCRAVLFEPPRGHVGASLGMWERVCVSVHLA